MTLPVLAVPLGKNRKSAFPPPLVRFFDRPTLFWSNPDSSLANLCCFILFFIFSPTAEQLLEKSGQNMKACAAGKGIQIVAEERA
jgi:hypothetical protein